MAAKSRSSDREFVSNETRRVEPHVSTDTHEALFFPNDWQVENRKLISALKHYAKINGIEILENTKVEKLIVEGDRVVGAETLVGLITADITVLATGAWTSLIKLGDAEMPFEVEPVRGQILSYNPLKRLFMHVICGSGGYLVPRLDGRILAGSTSEKMGFDKSVSKSAALELKKMACELVPRLADLQIGEQWVGLRPCALDGLPVLGSVDDIQGLFITTAHYRNGILLAPLTARLVAEKLVNSVDSEYFTTFGSARFKLRSVGTGS